MSEESKNADKRETKKDYKFAVNLSFIFNQFSNCFDIHCIKNEVFH